MKTGKDILSQEAIEIAAQWWADSLKRPQKDNGDDSENGAFAATFALINADRDKPSDEQIQHFKDLLIVAIQEDTVWGNGIRLNVDYQPEGTLATAAKIAQIEGSCFSWKTRMAITEKEIAVLEGYRASWRTIWKAE